MKDISASIHQRLLNLGRKEKLDFNRLLNLYAHERLLALKTVYFILVKIPE